MVDNEHNFLETLHDNEDEGFVVREDEFCPICNCHNGHSLSCATFPFNRIDGTVLKGQGDKRNLFLRDRTEKTLELPGGFAAVQLSADG
jgi:hypothetical protein